MSYIKRKTDFFPPKIGTKSNIMIIIILPKYRKMFFLFEDEIFKEKVPQNNFIGYRSEKQELYNF